MKKYRYRVFNLDLEIVTFITTTKQTNQAVCNELVNQGFNPLLYGWQLID